MEEINPIDGNVWLKFDSDEDETPSHEANIFRDGEMFLIEWYNVDVGHIFAELFRTFEEAEAWLEEAGYSDYTAY